MQLNTLTLLQLLPLVIATPVPQDKGLQPRTWGPLLGWLSGLRIPTGPTQPSRPVTQPATGTKNSYIVVLKDNVAPEVKDRYESKVNRCSGGQYKKYGMTDVPTGQTGFSGYQVSANNSGLQDMTSDSSVCPRLNTLILV